MQREGGLVSLGRKPALPTPQVALARPTASRMCIAISKLKVATAQCLSRKKAPRKHGQLTKPEINSMEHPADCGGFVGGCRLHS